MARITLPGAGTAGRAPTVNVYEEIINMPSSISWRSVLAGVVVALTLSIILNLLGMSLGFSTVDPATGDTPGVVAFTVFGAFWYVGTAVLSAFVGGFAASLLSNRMDEQLAGWHGLVTWAVSSLVVIYLVSSAIGGIIGGTLSAVGGAAQTAAVASMPAAMDANPLDELDSQVRAYTGNDPKALSDVATSNIRRMVYGQNVDVEQLRAQAVNAAMRANNMTEEQARTYVTQLEQDYRVAAEQVKVKAAEATEATAKGIARASIFAALTLLFGAVAGWMGGVFATTRAGATLLDSRRD